MVKRMLTGKSISYQKTVRAVFLMLIHLPERVVNFVEESLTENVQV